jgi:hypothetical protein
MSFRDATKPQDTGPDGLKPGRGTRTLRASVEAKAPASDLCTPQAPPDATRERILVWLAEGAREVNWALCSLPREHWVTPPSSRFGEWPVLRHARHLALREKCLMLPAVRQALEVRPTTLSRFSAQVAVGLDKASSDSLRPGPVSRQRFSAEALSESAGEPVSVAPILEFERADAAWDPAAALESAETIVRDLGETRFELLQLLEAAPDEAWTRSVSRAVTPDTSDDRPPVRLDWLLLHSRQHELEHLAAIWRISLNWDRVPRTPIPGVPLHPADRLEESH